MIGTTPRMLLSLPLLLAGCAAPGTELHPRAEDFAFLEIRLRG